MNENQTAHVQVTVREAPGEAVAGLAGELDLADAAAVARMLTGLLEAHGGLVVDLSGLRFMDSSGLHLLAGLRSRAGDRGWALEVRGARGGVARLLALAA